jgi:hypothetical protein
VRQVGYLQELNRDARATSHKKNPEIDQEQHNYKQPVDKWRVLRLRMEERPPIWRAAVNVGPCHHGMARPQVADGRRPPIWMAAVNKLNKQLRTADEGWSSSLGVGRGVNNPSR